MRQNSSHKENEEFVYADAKTGPADDVGVVGPEFGELSIATGSALVNDCRANLWTVRVAAAGSGHSRVSRCVIHIVGIAAAVEGELQGTHWIVICRRVLFPDIGH